MLEVTCQQVRASNAIIELDVAGERIRHREITCQLAKSICAVGRIGGCQAVAIDPPLIQLISELLAAALAAKPIGSTLLKYLS